MQDFGIIRREVESKAGFWLPHWEVCRQSTERKWQIWPKNISNEIQKVSIHFLGYVSYSIMFEKQFKVVTIQWPCQKIGLDGVGCVIEVWQFSPKKALLTINLTKIIIFSEQQFWLEGANAPLQPLCSGTGHIQFLPLFEDCMEK